MRFYLLKLTFSLRVVNMLKGLPADVVTALTVKAFEINQKPT